MGRKRTNQKPASQSLGRLGKKDKYGKASRGVTQNYVIETGAGTEGPGFIGAKVETAMNNADAKEDNGGV